MIPIVITFFRQSFVMSTIMGECKLIWAKFGRLEYLTPAKRDFLGVRLVSDESSAAIVLKTNIKIKKE